MFFDQEWHPDQCACTQCHQEEQQVLSQFEHDMNRLEDEVQKSNEFTSASPRHIETEWLAEGKVSLGPSDKSEKTPEVPPTPHNSHLTSSTYKSQTEDSEREEKRDSENTQVTGLQKQQKRNSSEGAAHASVDDVGLSFAREMYQHYEVRHVMHEQWPPVQAWSDDCKKDEQYINGTVHHQLSCNSNTHHHPPSDDDSCEKLNTENNNHHNHTNHNYHHSPTKGRCGGGTCFTTANQERYDSISAKKSKRKLTPGLKDTIKRRYKTLPLPPPTTQTFWLPSPTLN